MYLQKLTLVNFKNISQADLAFSRKLNCFVGGNGAGKTNIIDAIHYLSMCKSAFNLTDGQSVMHGCDFFVAEGQYVLGEDRRENICCGFRRNGGKTLKRNGKEYEKLSEHIGLLPVVLVSPADTSLIHESGDERRRYLNTLLSQLDREYLSSLIRYNHVLAERNRLLKQAIPPEAGELLEVLDEQLVRFGNILYEKRKALIEKLTPVAEKYYAVLSDDRETIGLSYKSDLNDMPFRETLRNARERDRVLQHTTTGIHRDDIRMSIGGHALRKYGSQGQQKSFLVALRLAQFEIIFSECGYKPLLLLDDIFDKLDMQRVERLIRLVSDQRFGQIFITDSNKVRLDLILGNIEREYKLFNVENGTIREEQA